MSVYTRLFVGNLPDIVDESELHQAFSQYGQIQNLEIKSKSTEDNGKKFAFITLSASNFDIESCIKTYTSTDFKGSRLYVTRARESFLERLQRERNQEQIKKTEKAPEHENLQKNPVINLSEKLNPRKRKIDSPVSKLQEIPYTPLIKSNKTPGFPPPIKQYEKVQETKASTTSEENSKKIDSERKRLESMKQKRQQFKEKQMIIKTGLIGIDKVQNKKVKFTDDDGIEASFSSIANKPDTHNNTLFSDGDSGDEVNFEIKKQFEGVKGQKVLDLQSRYKSDKRFVLDERFEEDETNQTDDLDDEQVDVGQADEKEKQFNILQDVLGVQIRPKPTYINDNKKTKPKLGMLRFDPSHPEHSKHLAPVEEVINDNKKSKAKRKDKQNQNEERSKVEAVEEKVEASKEQFYKVSETLKEAIAQPNSFSLRSLFGNKNEDVRETEQETGYIPLETPKAPKVKNPLHSGTKNPFVYDSSDSEHEDEEKQKPPEKEIVENIGLKETKAVWKENLFFSKDDNRLFEGLAYFNRTDEGEIRKERRELKSLMKKRLYNTERKNKMFQKKIGGRKKSMKKSFKKKS